MHEFSFGESIVRAAVEELAKQNARPGALKRVRVVVGELHQVVPDNLLMAYEVLSRDTPAAGSKLDIRFVPITVACRSCAWEGRITPPLFLCGSCGSGDLELKTGKELYLENLEVEQNGDAGH